ncbi:hypothetical protein Y032_0041g473 [Ancylostoma ceylanicum]|uniref:Uncharacterized protein n=1 Tax=Ancylostoma ceylanicum TaxID=53326 RepID=A0A016UHD4_9BILA|nr:hypothetical protein Y032_0041g473 [Ancylostoma ceylanicum]
MDWRYDDSFDISEFMREAGYPGTFRLPKSVLAVRKQANPISIPCGEVLTTGEFRGRRDYLEYLGISSEQEEPCHCRRPGYGVEDGYGDGIHFSRRNSRHHYGLADYKSNYLTGMMDRRPARLRSGMRHGAVGSRSDSSTFPTSHISQHTAASRSTSSHHVGPVTEVALNMFTPPNQQTWNEAAAPTPMNSAYVGVASYDASVGYNNVNGAVPTQVACAVPQMITADVQIIEPQPVNQGNMQNAEIGDVNEFFVTNVFQDREPSNNMPAQVGSPPMGNYQGETPFKPENVDYGYETGQMYPPVITQQVYPPQHEPPVVRTAAGGESDRIIKFEEPSDYEQPFPTAAPEEFANYDVVHGMPMTQTVHVVGHVEDVYTATDNAQPYAQNSAEPPNVDGSQYAAADIDNTGSSTLDSDKYIKEDSDDSDDSNLGQSFFSD